MHPETREIAGHMREFGLSILGRAVVDSIFSEMTKPFAHSLAVVHAAHGAEIILKARIAEQHPLLIFSKLPSVSTTPDLLNISDLFENGRTIEYEQLPTVLWAATGYRISRQQDFLAFGRLRNKIVHLGVPSIDCANETLKFCAEIIEQIVFDFWGVSAVKHAEDWDDAIIADGYLAERLQDLNIPVSLRNILNNPHE